MTVYINGVAQPTVGGFYGINVETLTGNKTLTPGTDKIYQYLDEGGANRTITLATAGATAGDRFVIRHNGSYTDNHYLFVYQGVTIIDKIWAGGIRKFVFDGTNWVPEEIGTGENDTKKSNLAIGFYANAYSSGVAIGYKADGYSSGVAVGYNAWGYSNGVCIGKDSLGYTNGVAIGKSANGHDYGIAIGPYADSNVKKYSIALGYYSKCERYGETSINIDADSAQKKNVVQGRWAASIGAAAGATEIFCAGQANQRFLIRANSVLAFKMTIVARDNVANEVAMYTVEDGLIKRDGAGNTVMVNCTVTVVHEDDAAWDCAVTADDVNEALIITCTGDGANPTQWAVRMDGVETHF